MQTERKDETYSITPILVALLPSFLSTFTGISWVEYILLALVTCNKVPGDLLIELRALEPKIPSKVYKKRENMVLAAYSLSPVIAGLGLYWVQSMLPNLVLLSHFSVSIFFFAAFLKPFMVLSGIFTDSMREKLLLDIVNVDKSTTSSDTQTQLKFQEISQMILDLDQKLNKVQQLSQDTPPAIQKQINQLKREIKLRTRVDEAERISLVETRVLHNEENIEIVFNHLLQREKYSAREQSLEVGNLRKSSVQHSSGLSQNLMGFYEWIVLWILGFPKNLFMDIFGGVQSEDEELWNGSAASSSHRVK